MNNDKTDLTPSKRLGDYFNALDIFMLGDIQVFDKNYSLTYKAFISTWAKRPPNTGHSLCQAKRLHHQQPIPTRIPSVKQNSTKRS
jgi:hypothetical protein